MKKFYTSIISCALIITAFTSCKKGGFLEQTITTNLDEATIFSDSAYVEGFIANIYADVGFSVNASRFGNGGLDAACDEAEVSSLAQSTALSFASGTINPAIVSEGAYYVGYKNIRAINKLLKNLPNTSLKPGFKLQREAEMHFLRAWYYAMLMQHYGGVPIVGDTLYNFTDNVVIKRSTYADCLQYILDEIDAAQTVLPVRHTDVSWGRASKGACLALKARVLLYAASPLFNGAPLTDDAELKPLTGYPVANADRWNLAADAANEVLGLEGYGLFTKTGKPGLGFQALFPQRVNIEYLFQWMRPVGNAELELIFHPPSRTGNGQGAFPYQGLVDAFPMRNGKLITDPSSGYDPNKPYTNRDPRLEFTVIHDQSLVGNRTTNGMLAGYSPVDIYTGTYEGQPASQDAVKNGTPTGYYTNKMLDTTALPNAIFATTNRCIPLLRYTEMLLNYAEAVNEAYGPQGALSSGYTPYSAIKAIRKRAGILPGADEMYGLKPDMNKDEMRVVIQHERRIELAFEGQRFWDVRRWMIADQTDNKQMNGMEVIRNETQVTYNIFPVRKHGFRKAMYLWPFPQAEVSKSPTLLQNPGY